MTNLSHKLRRYESMLFNNETTLKTDYALPGFDLDPPTKYKPKSTCQRIRPPPMKNLHTLTAWKGTHVPFYMYWKPKPIVREDPLKIQKRFEAPVDEELEKIRKTRPQLIMTPACSVDTIKDDSVRKLLTTDMYTSTAMYANRALSECVRVTAPFPALPAPANPVSLPKSRASYVSPEWRMETVSWDKKQLRCYCDPTAEFWLRKNISYCSTCKEAAIIKLDRDMKLAKPS